MDTEGEEGIWAKVLCSGVPGAPRAALTPETSPRSVSLQGGKEGRTGEERGVEGARDETCERRESDDKQEQEQEQEG